MVSYDKQTKNQWFNKLVSSKLEQQHIAYDDDSFYHVFSNSSVVWDHMIVQGKAAGCSMSYNFTHFNTKFSCSKQIWTKSVTYTWVHLWIKLNLFDISFSTCLKGKSLKIFTGQKNSDHVRFNSKNVHCLAVTCTCWITVEACVTWSDWRRIHYAKPIINTYFATCHIHQ